MALFVFSGQLLRMGSGATKKTVTETERIRLLHEPEPSIMAQLPFPPEKAEIHPQVAPMLDEIARFLSDSDHIKVVELTGHVDESDAATDEAREALSMKRAEAVKAALVERRIDAKRLESKSEGTNKPRAEGEANRDANRRVEFNVTKAETRELLDRFLAQHYIRLHTVPLGQWMSMDFANLAKLWNEAPCSQLIAELKEKGPRLGRQNPQIVDQVRTSGG